MGKAKWLNEENISQRPAIEVLERLGYKYIPPEEAERMRGNLYNVLLTDILKKKLIELNSYEYKGESYKFSKRNIEKAIKDLDAPLIDGLVRSSEKIYDSLMLGRSYEEHLPDGARRSFSINYIDWNNIENNDFHLVEEFRVEREDGEGHIRPDIVLFINGIPFSVIECKRSSINIRQGISQTIRNQRKEHIPNLYKYAQILISTNNHETKYGTVNTPERFWSIWKEEEEAWLQDRLNKVVTGRLATNQDKNLISLLDPARLLELTKYFVLFDKNDKKIARYQQYFAVKEITRTIEERDEKGNRKSGVIWHTQGSGKSLTMTMFSRYVLSELRESSPKLVVVTDRINLDKQIHQTFNHTRLKASRAATGRHLIELINDSGTDIITTLVHKFDTAAEHQKPVLSKDIFVLVDESHRSQYGEMHLKMKKVFPNACYLGFTGTPLMKEEKNTMIRFGELIHTYTIADAVKDKTIVPLLYEGKMIAQTVNRKAIDRRLEMITRKLNDKQKEEVMKKWSRFEKIASSDQRLGLIAFDINEHFLKNYKTQGSQFKAMLATNSKVEAIRYYDEFQSLGDLNAAVVISPPDQREGHSEVDEISKDMVTRFWTKMMDKYGNEENYEETIKNEFVAGDEVDILIVVDKLLTGFDAPRATVMYIDKPMKEHTLLQAIARVNRLYEGKDYGIIIDYRGLLDKLDEAMEMYSGAGLEKFDPEDLKGALYDVISIVGSLRSYYTELTNIFIRIKNKDDMEEYQVLLEDEELREHFYNTLSSFGRNLSIALESERIYEALSQDEIDRYKKDFRFYQELRKAVKLRYSDTIDHKEYEAKMQNLMDNYIAAEDVLRITNPVDILDEKGFERELERLGTPRGKADAIRTRLTRSIQGKWEENPAYYKKFSERIEETLEAYKERRISEKEYFERMKKLKKDYQDGDSGIEYPETIKYDTGAQPYYGTAMDMFNESNESYEGTEDTAQLAIEIKKIIEKHVQVDWQDNVDIHNRIRQELDDLIFDFKDQKRLNLNIDQIDRMIEEIIKISLNRYGKY